MSDQLATETIFNTEPTQTQPTTEGVAAVQATTQEPVVPVDQYADLLQSITASDGRQKYTDVTAALNSVAPSQEHISKLEGEMATLKEELSKRKTAEEIMSTIESQAQTVTEPPSVQPVDLSQLESMVDNRLQAVESQKTAAGNTASVTSKMSEVYGEKAEEMFYKAGVDNGLSVQALNQLAATSPKAALKLAGIGESTAPNMLGKTTSSVNTEALSTTQHVVTPSAKVPVGATTGDMVNAWRNARK